MVAAYAVIALVVAAAALVCGLHPLAVLAAVTIVILLTATLPYTRG